MKFVFVLLMCSVISFPLYGQPRPVRVTGMASQGLTTKAADCESCSTGFAHNLAVDLVVLDKIGIGVRTLRWNSEPGVQVMSFNMIGVDWFPVDRRRIRPYVTGGFGVATTEFRVPQGAHAETVDSASNIFALSAGGGVDLRLASHLALTPSLTMYHTALGGTHRECTQRNYTLGDFSWYCGKSTSWGGVTIFSLAVGIGWR
jgi:hypothetical protein